MAPQPKSSTKDNYKAAKNKTEDLTEQLEILIQESEQLTAQLNKATPQGKPALADKLEKNQEAIQQASKDLEKAVDHYQENAADYKNESMLGALASAAKGGLGGIIIAGVMAIMAAKHHASKNSERKELKAANKHVQDTGSAYQQAIKQHGVDSPHTKQAHKAFKNAQEEFQKALGPTAKQANSGRHRTPPANQRSNATQQAQSGAMHTSANATAHTPTTAGITPV